VRKIEDIFNIYSFAHMNKLA